MIDFVKIDNSNFPKLVVEGQDRFALVEDDNSLLGASVIDTSVDVNRIVININEKYRGMGHGKNLFLLTLDEYKEKFDDKDLTFEVQNTSQMNAILSQNGALHIGTDEGISKYVLPL